jgi:hypothetical protein
MRWFGKSWGAPVCEPETVSETPVGTPCGGCESLIKAGDYGVILPFAGAATDPSELSYHHGCFMRMLGLKDTTLEPEKVHILHEGLPLCRFTQDVPADWPQGHKWVSKTEPGANCQACLIERLVAL